MTLGELRTLASSMCEDPSLTKFSSTKYNDALNKANIQFALDSKCLFKDASITVVVDTAAYNLPTDFILEKEVTFNGKELKPLSRSTIQRIKTGDRWDDDSGTPIGYIIDPEEGRKTITLYPIPNSIDEGADLILTYYPLPVSMTSDSDTPLNSSALLTQFHTALSAYASWLLMLYLTQTAEIAQKRDDLFGTYNAKVTEAIQMFGNTKSEPLSFHVDNVRVR